VTQRRLRFLKIVTHSVESIEVATAAWTHWLGYQLVAEGRLNKDLCSAWDTPQSTGQRYCILQPASGAEVFIRFIENSIANSYTPASYGWSATELLVTDPDQLLRDLADSPFTHVAGPLDLFPQQKSPRALQMYGPSGELLYFTRILPGGSRYGMKGAVSPVDRPFIVPIGGPSMIDMHRFYGDQLGLRTMEPISFVNGIMARACGVDSQTPFSMSIAPIPGRRFLIELDELPGGLKYRPIPPGQLPTGMAMVSFLVECLEDIPVPLCARPETIQDLPYNGRRTAVIRGPAGEWLELIERQNA
jgi:hypothetical protein